MALERRSTEARQAELTDAALRIIATKGIAALTTRSLADEVGLTSGAIFRHFASLDDLLGAVVARVDAVLEATYPPEDLPALERLERFVAARSAAVGGQIGILRLVLSEQFVLALPDSGSARITRCMDKTRAFLVQCLREAQESGDVRSDVPAEALAPVVMGTIQMLALSTANARQRLLHAGGVRETLFTLLRPPGSSGRAKRGTTQGGSSR